MTNLGQLLRDALERGLVNEQEKGLAPLYINVRVAIPLSIQVLIFQEILRQGAAEKSSKVDLIKLFRAEMQKSYGMPVEGQNISVGLKEAKETIEEIVVLLEKFIADFHRPL